MAERDDLERASGRFGDVKGSQSAWQSGITTRLRRVQLART